MLKIKNYCPNFYNMILLILAPMSLLLSVSGILVYIAFGATALSVDKKIINDFPQCDLWYYVLVNVILIPLCILYFSRLYFIVKKTSLQEKLCYISTNLFTNMIFFICILFWGYTQLYGKSCISLKETHLWDFSYATFIIQICIISFSYIFSIALNLIYWKKNRDRKNSSNEQYMRFGDRRV